MKNILIIVADQLLWKALRAYGNNDSRTPNIDKICNNGVRFDQCYTSCPLCQPARASLWTSKHCHEIDVLSNGEQWKVSKIDDDIPTLGEVFRNAGYDTVHYGKTHDSGGLRGFYIEPEDEIVIPNEYDEFPLNKDTYRDVYTAQKSVEYIKNRSKNNPFLMVADFVNPHNICAYVGKNKTPNDKSTLPDGRTLPQLPKNFDFTDIANRSKAVQYICCSHNRQAEASLWKENDFRLYMAAYYYYLEKVDTHIGEILDALEKTGQKDNTMIVFLADHGDSLAARGRVTKQVDFYEEVTRVPLVFSGSDIKHKNTLIKGVASTLDIFPTLCSYANLDIPENLRGADLMQSINFAKDVCTPYVVSQWHTEWGYTVSPGRMVCTPNYKYIYYIEDDFEELYDLKKDPFEKINIAKDDIYKDVLCMMQNHFKEYLELYNDNFMNQKYEINEKWRSHELGYLNHRGLSAPMEYKQKI